MGSKPCKDWKIFARQTTLIRVGKADPEGIFSNATIWEIRIRSVDTANLPLRKEKHPEPSKNPEIAELAYDFWGFTSLADGVGLSLLWSPNVQPTCVVTWRLGRPHYPRLPAWCEKRPQETNQRPLQHGLPAGKRHRFNDGPETTLMDPALNWRLSVSTAPYPQCSGFHRSQVICRRVTAAWQLPTASP